MYNRCHRNRYQRIAKIIVVFNLYKAQSVASCRA